MGYEYSLQRKAKLIAEELGIEDLEVGQHEGFTIEYVWMFTGNWKKKYYYFAKSDQWMRFWTISRKDDAVFSADMSGEQDFVKELFDADEMFPNGKILDWDYMDHFTFVISDLNGTRTIQMDGEAYGDLARLESAVMAVAETAQLSYQIRELNSRLSDAAYVKEQLGLESLFDENEPFEYEYLWKTETPGLTITVVKTAAWRRALCQITRSNNPSRTFTVDLPPTFTDPMASLLRNTERLEWHIPEKYANPYRFYYMTPHGIKSLIAAHSDDDMIDRLISANNDILKTILKASIPNSVASALGLERFEIGRQGDTTVEYIRIVPYAEGHPPHIVVTTGAWTKMLTYEDDLDIRDQVELRHWDDPLLSLLKRVETFKESGKPHEKTPYLFLSVATPDFSRDVLALNQEMYCLPGPEPLEDTMFQAFRAAAAARLMQNGLDTGLWKWDLLKRQGVAKFGMDGLFAGQHVGFFVEYFWICRVGRIRMRTTMLVKTNRWAKAIHYDTWSIRSSRVCSACNGSPSGKSEEGTACFACQGSGKERFLPEPVELCAWNDTFYSIIRNVQQLPCIVTKNYDTVSFFLVTPEDTKVFFVPLSEDKTIRQLVEAADEVAREFLAHTTPEDISC